MNTFSPCRLLILFLLLVAICGCTSSAPSFYLGGIQVNEESQQHWISSLKRSKYNTVAVTIYAHQGDWDSDNFWFDSENAGVLNEIREAKLQGLQVVLILRVALDHAYIRNQFLWHGMIMPKTDVALKSWMSKYRRYILTWAKIAEKEKVDILGIGSELNSLTSTKRLEDIPPLIEFYLDEEKQSKRRKDIIEQFISIGASRLSGRGDVKYKNPAHMLQVDADTKQSWALSMCGGGKQKCVSKLNARREKLEKFWRSLALETRNHYSGLLTYAANFDQYQEVGFWSELDIIGINAYFPLRRYYNVAAVPEVLQGGWEEVFSQIETMRKDSFIENKPVILTELGFTFRKNSTLEPWSSEGYSLVESSDKTSKLLFWKEQEISYEERLAALKALKHVSNLHPNVLKGILYWKLSTYEAHREIEPFVHILESSDDSEFDQVLRGFLKTPKESRYLSKEDSFESKAFFINRKQSSNFFKTRRE